MKKKKIFVFPLLSFAYFFIWEKFNRTQMKNTDKIYNGLVRLPLYPGLKKTEVTRIIKEVKKFNLIKT